MDRRTFLAVAGGGLSGIAGCLSLAQDEYDVGMTVNEYVPEVYTVEVGDEVVWQNTSSRNHSVTAYEARIPDDAEYFASGGFENEAAARDAWDSVGETGMFGPGGRYAHQFEVPGEYDYVCLPHERKVMVGTIVVEE